MVERYLAKVDVASSTLVSRSIVESGARHEPGLVFSAELATSGVRGQSELSERSPRTESSARPREAVLARIARGSREFDPRVPGRHSLRESKSAARLRGLKVHSRIRGPARAGPRLFRQNSQRAPLTDSATDGFSDSAFPRAQRLFGPNPESQESANFLIAADLSHRSDLFSRLARGVR